MIKDLKYIDTYLSEFKKLISFDEKIVRDIIKIKKILINKSKKNKVLIFGNGGSAAISSHVSVDLTKNAGVEAMNYNESDLITCFANDFGYEHWIDKAVNYYAKKNDILILISVSGSSPNVVNAAKNAKKNGIKHVITLTGKDKNNPLKKIGDTNIFINSKSYNMVENAHQVILLLLVDSIIQDKSK